MNKYAMNSKLYRITENNVIQQIIVDNRSGEVIKVNFSPESPEFDTYPDALVMPQTLYVSPPLNTQVITLFSRNIPKPAVTITTSETSPFPPAASIALAAGTIMPSYPFTKTSTSMTEPLPEFEIDFSFNYYAVFSRLSTSFTGLQAITYNHLLGTPITLACGASTFGGVFPLPVISNTFSALFYAPQGATLTIIRCPFTLDKQYYDNYESRSGTSSNFKFFGMPPGAIIHTTVSFTSAGTSTCQVRFLSAYPTIIDFSRTYVLNPTGPTQTFTLFSSFLYIPIPCEMNCILSKISGIDPSGYTFSYNILV